MAQQPKKLTIEQERKMFLTPCKNRNEVKAWIKRYLGLELPDVTVSRFADTNPLDVVYEVYEICVLRKNPNKIKELLYVAGRGSGKTLGMAIAELMVLLHDKRDVVHVGAIQNQADRCYAYQKNFLYSSRLKHIVSPADLPEEQRILEKANMSHSVFNIGSDKASIEVLPCTLKAVNGPHVPLVVVDEIDTVSGEGLKAFKDIAGMLDSKGGKPQLRVGISTRKSRYGLMNKQIESMEASADKSRVVRRWTAFEFSERCPDSRSGTKPIELWVNQERMEVLQEEDFLKKDKGKQKEYIKHDALDGCAHCPLFAICLTDAKKQTSSSPMLKSLEDIVQKVMSEGADWALAQLMNLKPSVEGIIYREFDEKTHVKDWNQMWLILTGKEYPGECTHDMFVRKCHELQIPCYAGIDWGFSAPNTVVYFFVDKRDNIYIVRCDGMTYISEPTWIHYLKTKYNAIYRCQLYVPDAANQGAILEMQKAGLPVANQADKGQINTGVQTIKKFLRFPGNNMPKMFFAKETTQHIVNEFGLYHYKVDAAGLTTDTPDTEYDHWLDALRYAVTLLFGKQAIVLGEALDFDTSFKLQDTMGNYNRAPDAIEFAASRGLRFNSNEEDRSKLGKIGTSRELEENLGEEGASGGGMLWTFD
jgi:phage terminase large subunit